MPDVPLDSKADPANVREVFKASTEMCCHYILLRDHFPAAAVAVNALLVSGWMSAIQEKTSANAGKELTVALAWPNRATMGLSGGLVGIGVVLRDLRFAALGKHFSERAECLSRWLLLLQPAATEVGFLDQGHNRWSYAWGISLAGGVVAGVAAFGWFCMAWVALFVE